MTYFHSSDHALPHIPDNITISQFMLDYQHDIRPMRKSEIPCLVDDITGRCLTFDSLKAQTENLANGLHVRYRIGNDDTVLIISPNHMNYIISIWAVHKLGGIVSFSNPQSKADELAYQLKTARVTHMIVHSSLLGTAFQAAFQIGMPSNRIIILDESFPLHLESHNLFDIPTLIAIGAQEPLAFDERKLDPGEGNVKIALLCWSSGTTGKPKAVAIPHRALIANIIQMAIHNEVHTSSKNSNSRSWRPGDVASGVLPFYHVAGLVIGLHLTIFAAMTTVVIPKFDLLGFLKSIFIHKITHLILVPPIATVICKHPIAQKYDFQHVKYVLIGAAPVSKEIQEVMGQICRNAQVGQAYGLTEMTTTLSMVSGMQRRGPLGSAGRLLPGIQARVIKPDGSLAKCGERGELVVKGPCMASGYLHNLNETKETFVEGWVRTGDEVSLSADHEVYVYDRLKEFLKVKGLQVSPSELEDCLLSHPDIADVCVVGVPDDYNGEVPLAYVVLTASAKESLKNNPGRVKQYNESIVKHVEARKSRYKHLQGGVRLVNEIPKNPSGKILRRVLRQDALNLFQADHQMVKL